MLFVLPGCASLKPSTPEEAVAQRAQAYFDAVIAKDYKTSYSLHSPSYRGMYSYEAHVLRSAGSGINYLTAKVLRVNCPSAEACVARVEISYKAGGLRIPVEWPVTTMLEDRWAHIDGEWVRILAQ
jgi:hypothetical protein